MERFRLPPQDDSDRPRDAQGRIILPKGVQIAGPTYVTNRYVTDNTPARSTKNVVPGEESNKYSWLGSNEGVAQFAVKMALVGGHEGFGKDPVYIIRGWNKDDLLPGFYSLKDKKGYVTNHGSNIKTYDFDILLAKPHDIKWVAASNGDVPECAIPAGKTNDGEVLYIGRGSHQLSIIPGKLQQSQKKCFIGVKEEELGVSDYEVLCSV